MARLSYLSPPPGQSVGGVWSTAGDWRRGDSVKAIGRLTSNQRPRAANNGENTEKAQSKLNKLQRSQRKRKKINKSGHEEDLWDTQWVVRPRVNPFCAVGFQDTEMFPE